MDPRLFVERLLDDEAITDGLMDGEARLIVAWGVALIEKRVTAVESREDAAAITDDIRKRARTIAQCVLAASEDEDPERTRTLLDRLGHTDRELPIGADHREAVARQLIEWEERKDA